MDSSVQRPASSLTPSAQIASVLPGVVYQVVNYPDKSRRCLFVNDAIQSMMGISPSALMQDVSVFDQIVHPDDRGRIIPSWETHNKSLRPWAQQYRLLIPGKGTIWIQSVAHIEPTADGGIMWTGFITDITSIKRAEEALQISEERIALAARAGKVGLWDYDFITHEIIWNETQFELHGVHPDSHVPNLQNNMRFLHPDSHALVEAAFKECVESGAHEYQVECQIVRADGEIRTTRSSAFIIRDEKGEPIRAVGTEVDITEEKRLMETLASAREAAEAATRTKSDFLARMSHEIRTPLNAIVAPAELLSSSDLSPAHQELAAMIVTAGEHLLQIVNDILDFSKLEAGKMSLVVESFSLETLIDETIGLMQVLANKKHIHLRTDISDSVRRTWLGDVGRIKQVLLNLLSNAIKFTSQGEVLVRVSLERQEQSVHDIHFEVVDTGIGFAEQDNILLFQPFEQIRSRLPDYQSGTGLGLSICRDLVELMDGFIGSKSTPNIGSTFWFTIPLTPSLEKPKTPIPRPKTSPTVTSSARNARVLIVEDNSANRRVVSLLLKRLGYASAYAVNGHEAIEKYRGEKYDLILMDFEMPVMNGLVATREIRNSEPPGTRIPIVGLTAHVSPEYQQACREAGMDDILFKPVIMADLHDTLLRLLD